jgi:membrane-anchored mycosin MYCP
MNKITEGVANEFIGDEFVVATPHRDLVMQRLTGTKVTVTRESPELDLSLLTLSNVRQAAAEVRRQREAEGIDAPRTDGPGKQHDLEQLLAELRAIFAHRYDGWTPAMGKNRVMRGIQLYPYPAYIGEDRPAPVTGKKRPDPITANGSAGDRARVMILDTQIRAHPYLDGRYIAAPGSLLDSTNTKPLDWWAGHATFVAGLVIQRAPAVQLELEAVLTEEGRSRSAWDVAVSMVRCADRDVDILNLSLGCFTLDGDPPLVLDRAIQRITPKMVVVAAAGNFGASEANAEDPPTARTPVWPAAFEQVVAVGANKYGGERAPFSPHLPWVDLMAPGYWVESTYLEGPVSLDSESTPTNFTGMAKWNGTSFAAAAVSGAIAARTEPGRRTAYEALEDLRAGNGGESSRGIETVQFVEDVPGR